jgi:hypothetical protein
MKSLLRRYGDRCKLLDDSVKKHLQEIGAARKDYAELKTRHDELEKAKKEEADAATARYAKLQGEKEQVETKLGETTRTSNAEIEKLKAEKRQLESKVTQNAKDIELLKKTVVQKDEHIKKLLEPKKDAYVLVPPGAEPADGKVLTVEADGQYVMIDIGRRDWASEGMEFRVYDETNPDARKEKGRLQVRRVYDTISQAKILQQDAMDPILRDMVIVNPAFSRGRKLNFVLEGRFNQPNVQRLLEHYPCKVEVGVGKVTQETDYLVVGEARRNPGEPHWKDSENAKLADKYGVRVLMERDMLRYLGED